MKRALAALLFLVSVAFAHVYFLSQALEAAQDDRRAIAQICSRDIARLIRERAELADARQAEHLECLGRLARCTKVGPLR